MCATTGDRKDTHMQSEYYFEGTVRSDVYPDTLQARGNDSDYRLLP